VAVSVTASSHVPHAFHQFPGASPLLFQLLSSHLSQTATPSSTMTSTSNECFDIKFSRARFHYDKANHNTKGPNRQRQAADLRSGLARTTNRHQVELSSGRDHARRDSARTSAFPSWCFKTTMPRKAHQLNDLYMERLSSSTAGGRETTRLITDESTKLTARCSRPTDETAVHARVCKAQVVASSERPAFGTSVPGFESANRPD
jgi:hypothetical protein